MNEKIWVTIGLLAQAMFTMRFLVQWVVSERKGVSVIPLAFWYFSIAGASLLLAYAIYRKDPVFIIGQISGLCVYSRNLFLIAKEKKG